MIDPVTGCMVTLTWAVAEHQRNSYDGNCVGVCFGHSLLHETNQLSDVLHSKHQHVSGICMLMLRGPQEWML